MKRGVLLLLNILIISTLSAQIKMGAERTDNYFPLLSGKKIAVCGNQSSRLGTLHLVDSLLHADFQVVKIFCPEHGFRGEAEAGAKINSSIDEKTGLPIVSLYGSNRKPTKAQMSDIQVVIFDIQDVGCRFYTYISTLHLVMEAAAEAGVEVIVLDRPNPNGYYVAGPVLEPEYSSFVGMHQVPIVHGMTIGEFAQMINEEGWLANKMRCKLTVIPMENWTHDTRYSLPIAPSPNLQTDEAVNLYASLCLFEGTVVSVGRGTELPFQIFGHSEMTIGDYTFTPKRIPGVSENPPQQGKKCRGFNLTSSAKANLKTTNNNFTLKYLVQAYQNFPDQSRFFERPTFFDKLAGTSKVREMVVAGKSAEEIEASWQKPLEEFKVMRQQYLLYH